MTEMSCLELNERYEDVSNRFGSVLHCDDDSLEARNEYANQVYTAMLAILKVKSCEEETIRNMDSFVDIPDGVTPDDMLAEVSDKLFKTAFNTVIRVRDDYEEYVGQLADPSQTTIGDLTVADVQERICALTRLACIIQGCHDVHGWTRYMSKVQSKKLPKGNAMAIANVKLGSERNTDFLHDNNMLHEHIVRQFIKHGYVIKEEEVLVPRGKYRFLDKVGSIEEIIAKFLSKDYNPAYGAKAMKTLCGNYSKMVAVLTGTPDHRIRTSELTSGMYSFKNSFIRIDPKSDAGVKVLPFDSPEFEEDFSIKRFSDVLVEPEWAQMEDYMNIPTPHFSSILDFQEIPEDAQRVIMASIGRLMFPLNSYDHWESCLFFKGVGGSGKSTIVENVARQLFETEDIGYVSDTCQTTFVLSGIYNKRLGVLPEVTERLALSTPDFLQMCSGGAVEVKVKHETSVQVARWSVPLIMAGNQMPGFTNHGGSVSRRVLIVQFKNPVPDNIKDGELPKKLRAEMGAIIVKCARAYIAMLKKLDGKPLSHEIKNIPYLSDATKKACDGLNPLLAFLDSGKCDFGPNHSCTMNEFRSAFNHFNTMQMNRRAPKFDEDLYGPLFKTRGIRVMNKMIHGVTILQ